MLVNDVGETLAELSEFLGIRTNNFAEYAGLLASLQWTLDHGYKRLEIVSDSDLMVKQIQGKYQVKSPDLRPLWVEARRRIALLDSFTISHALRHKNKAADRLANEAMDRGMGRAVAGAPPPAAPKPPVNPEAAAARNATPSPGSARAANPPGASTMLRGFTRGGAIHLLGGASLPDGIFVKIIPE